MMLLVMCIVFSVILHQPVNGAEETASTWTKLDELPTGRGGLGVAVASGKIFAIGGSNSDSDLNINEAYEPNNGKWVTKKSMPTARSGFAIASFENKIYVFGGAVRDAFTGNVEVYDLITDTWQTKASMPTPRADLCANVVNGKIYLIGGKTYSSTSPYYAQTGINEVYDPATNTWSTNASIPVAVQGYASTVIGSKIYIMGGTRQSVLGSDTFTNALQIFDTEAGTWLNGKSMDQPTSYGAAVATTDFMAPKRIYYFGGYMGTTFTNKTQVYDPANNVWTSGAEMPTVRAYLGVAEINDVIYAVGGFDGANWLNSNEQYKPLEYGKIPPKIQIVSPESKTYSSVTLSYTVNKATSWVGYSLDNQANKTVTSGVALEGLSDGQHSIIVYANDSLGNMGVSNMVTFYIDTFGPTITIFDPENQTYSLRDIHLTFTIDEPASKLSYVLDGEQEVSITGNVTLPALPDGAHSITVYGTDEIGNTAASETVYFSISTFPTFWVAAAIATTTILFASGYLVIKRRKPSSKEGNNVLIKKKGKEKK